MAKRCQQITLAIGPSSATPSAQLRRVRPATGIADPATLLPLRVAMPSSVGSCRRSRDLLPARGTAQPVPVRRPGDLTLSACHSLSVSRRHCENAEDAMQSVVESSRAAEPADGRASLPARA